MPRFTSVWTSDIILPFKMTMLAIKKNNFDRLGILNKICWSPSRTVWITILRENPLFSKFLPSENVQLNFLKFSLYYFYSEITDFLKTRKIGEFGKFFSENELLTSHQSFACQSPNYLIWRNYSYFIFIISNSIPENTKTFQII